MANRILDLESYLNKYKEINKNLFVLYTSYNYQYKELKEVFGYNLFCEKTFVNMRKILLPSSMRKTPKNPNQQIRLNNFINLDVLRQKYNNYFGYDGIEITAKEKEIYEKYHQKPIWFNSCIKFELHYLDTQGIERIHYFLNFHQEGSHSEKVIHIQKLWNKIASKYLKHKDVKEIFENQEFYIVADKHRAIVSFLNDLKLDSFISSNPTTKEKHENSNFQIKVKAFLSTDFEDFESKLPSNYTVIYTKNKILKTIAKIENMDISELMEKDNFSIMNETLYNENMEMILEVN